MEESDGELLNCTQLLVPDVAQWRLNHSQLMLLLEAALNSADTIRRRAFANCLGGDGGPVLESPAPRPYHLPWWQKLAWTLVFSAMLLVATGGNLIVMWIVLAHRRMRTVTNYFLVNLSLSDLMMALLNCVFNFVFMLNSDWPFGPIYCSINNFVANVTVASSVFTLVAISLDRYMAIVRPLHHRTSRRRAGLALAAIWLCSALLALPCAMYSTTMTMRYSSGQTRQVCYMLWPDGRYPTSMTEYVYNLIFLSVTYLGPVTAMAVCYTLMGRELWGSRSIGELTHRQSESIKCKKKVVRMFILVVTIFALCWLPYHGYFIYVYHNKSISTSSYVQHLYLAFYWLAMANAMVNPVIYYWMNNRFRLYFQQVICRCCCLRRRAKTDLEMPTLKSRAPTLHSHSELRRSRSGRNLPGVTFNGEPNHANSHWRRRTQESHVTLRSVHSLPRVGGGGSGNGCSPSPCALTAPALPHPPAPTPSPSEVSPPTAHTTVAGVPS